MADKRSFEEQVREQLADINIQPEAGVWENVGNALKQDRKRRWMIWFLLLAGVAGAASYGVYRALELPQPAMQANTTAIKNEIVLAPVVKDSREKGALQAELAEKKIYPALVIPSRLARSSAQAATKAVVSTRQEKPAFDDNEIRRQLGDTAEKRSGHTGEPRGVQSDRIAESGQQVVHLKTADPESPVKPSGLSNDSAGIVPSSNDTADVIAAAGAAGKISTVATTRRKWKWNAIVDLGGSGLYQHKATCMLRHLLLHPTHPLTTRCPLSVIIPII